MDAAVAEVAVGHPVEAGVAQQRVEATQVGAQPVRRHRGVLPPCVRGPLQAAGRQPGAVLPDPPERGHLGHLRHQSYVDRAGVAGHGVRRCAGFLDRRAGDLREEPARSTGQGGDGPAPGPDHVDDPGVESLAGDQGVVQQGRHGVGGLEHVGVAEHREGAGGRVLDEPHGRAGDHPEGALAADQEPVEVAAPLRQQVLEGVAGDLTGEAAEPGADGAEVVGHECVEPVVQRGAGAVEPGAVGGEHVERDDVVGGPSVAEGAGAARVVADHPADRAAGVGRRVRAEAQPVPGGGLLQGGVHGAGLDRGGARLGVDRQHPVEVPRDVDDDAGAHGVAGDRRTGAAHGQRGAGLAGDGQGRGQLVGVAGTGHDLWDDAVERRVRGVERPGQGGVVGVGDPGPAQLGEEVAHHSSSEPRRMPARSSSVASRGAVASSRCCLSVPATRSSTSASV